MALINPRVSVLCATLCWLTVACASRSAVRPGELTDQDSVGTRRVASNTVTAEDLEHSGDDAIIKALSTKVPGVWVGRTANGTLVVRIRGASSIQANSEPLYVIDGVTVQPGPGGALLGLNPHDVASIEVLKDAASLSFYGVRAANGVIVIRTKNAN